MKKKLSTILTVLLVAIFTISTADAGGGIKISSATFTLGSLIAEGFLQGTGQATITVVLTAEGKCDGKDVSAIGVQPLYGNEESGTENTQRSFYVETNDPEGCSNDTDTQQDFVFWTKATISVYSGVVTIPTPTPPPCGTDCGFLLSSAITISNPLLVEQAYACTTSFEAHTVACTPIRGHGSNNNGTVAICHATGSSKHPYVLLKVNAKGLNGHSKHAGDIIPAPANGCP